MKLLKKLHKKESGQAFILVLILLVLGGLIIAPLLGFMSTGLIAGQANEKRMAEVYAADAGIEDAIYKIIKDDTLLPEDEDDSYTYTLTDPVNGETVDVTITKLSLLQGILSEDEYKLNQPHENWITFSPPSVIDSGEGYLEYEGTINFLYDPPTGSRTIQSVGAFFSPLPGDPNDEDLIEGPYGYVDTGTGVFQGVFDNLDAYTFERKVVSMGFAFIWRWPKVQDRPLFDNKGNDLGTFTFRFTVNNPDWHIDDGIYFIWATIQEQDISYIVSAEFWKWLVEANAGGTTVQSALLTENGAVDMLTWEINPPE